MHERGTSRRKLADRRSIIQRRSATGRRTRSRRATLKTVDTDLRSKSDRRAVSDRRVSERRAGVSRRFSERRKRQGTVRVLVVDGQEAVRTGMCRVLDGAGIEAIEAREGHAGLNFYGETPSDAIVVNLSLPDMDGVEFIRQVCDRNPNTRIVAIAGRQSYGAPDPLAMAERFDVRPLRWPFGPDGLLEAVNEVISVQN